MADLNFAWSTAVISSLGVLAAAWLAKCAFRRQSAYPLPPGPRGWPLIGNVLQLPRNHEWLTYHEWSKVYGDVLHLSIFGQSVVVLNSWRATNDLLDKRSAIYSDRPRLVMAGELVGYDQSVPLGRYNERLRESRKLLHQMLGPRQALQFLPMEEDETAVFLSKLLDNPERFLDHIRNMVGSKILQVAYGYRPRSDDDELVSIVTRAMNDFSVACVPGSYLVDFLPWLKHVPSWFPGAGFKGQAKRFRQSKNDMHNVPYYMVKEQIASGNFKFSFASNLLEGKENLTPAEEDLFKWAMTGVYGGGADTTVSALSTFFLAMVLHPGVQKRAQAEIDAVVGNDRLPTFSDRPKLPYIDQVLKEVLRWNPVGPLALPHRVTEDDVYNGYTIPAGAIVIPNAWAMLHDPATYPNPMSFDPDRFSQSSQASHPGLNKDPHNTAFGFGRRICPGMHLVDGTLWSTMAFTLAAFDLLKEMDENGTPIEPRVEYTSETISHPKPFKGLVVPRSPKVVSLIRSRASQVLSTVA